MLLSLSDLTEFREARGAGSNVLVRRIGHRNSFCRDRVENRTFRTTLPLWIGKLRQNHCARGLEEGSLFPFGHFVPHYSPLALLVLKRSWNL